MRFALVFLSILALSVFLLPGCKSAPVKPDTPSLCPEGANLVGSPPPQGKEQFCKKSNGDKHGMYKKWFLTGTLDREGEFQDNVEQGQWIFYYQSGQKWCEIQYKDGKEHGLSVCWHENGNKQSERNFDMGKKHGDYASWFANGQMNLLGAYKFEDKHGLWTEWDEQGNVIEKIRYIEGMEISQ